MTLFQLLALHFSLKMLTPNPLLQLSWLMSYCSLLCLLQIHGWDKYPSSGSFALFSSFCQNALFPDGNMGHALPSCTQMSPSQRCLSWPSLCKILHAPRLLLHLYTPRPALLSVSTALPTTIWQIMFWILRWFFFFNFAHKNLPSRIQKKKNPHADMSKTLITIFICLKI